MVLFIMKLNVKIAILSIMDIPMPAVAIISPPLTAVGISNDMYIKTNVCNKDGMKQYMGMTSSHEILFESDIGGITNTNERMLMEQPHTINPKSRNPRLHVSIEPRTHQAHAFKETHAINIDKTYQR